MREEPKVERDKALEMAKAQVERQFGKGSLMRLGEAAHEKMEVISTGALSLDLALGIGGVPRGRIVELFGPESSGKSTLALHVVAEAQRNSGIAAYIDVEHALDPNYAKAIGVDIDELLISQPDTGEQALEIADILVRSGALDVVVIDSVAALVPRVELEGEMGDAHVGLQARLMSQALRKLAGTLGRSKTTALFINQLREKIGVLFGPSEVTPGGRALKFYASVRIDLRKVESIKDGQDNVGNRVRAKVAKNKCLAEGTLVFDPSTGHTHRIEEIVESGVGLAVMAADKRGQLHVRTILQRFDQGDREVIALRLDDGTQVRATHDHKILTDKGWKEAGTIGVGDGLARPRQALGFGDDPACGPNAARLVGYLIGDGYVGGKTPIAFSNTAEELHEDVKAIAATLGCITRRRGIELAISHRPKERNGVLELARWAGIWGSLAAEKKLPPAFFDRRISGLTIANLIFGLFETDGYVSREQAGGLRLGYTTTSEQLAHQLHWLLLRWGIGSSVRRYNPSQRRPSIVRGRRILGKLPQWEVRVTGIENVTRFAEVIPMWGPRGRKLVAALADPALAKHRGSQRQYLPASHTEPVLGYLRHRGVTPGVARQLIGGGPTSADSLKGVLGLRRLRRDRIERLAEALDSQFLRDVLGEDVWYDRVVEVTPSERCRTYDIEVEEDHTLVANDVVVSNCSAPFRQAEFDIIFGEGISREGSLLDIAVDMGIVRKSGAWFTYDGDQLGQGRENAKRFLRENAEVAMQLQAKIYEQVGMGEVTGEKETEQASAEE